MKKNKEKGLAVIYDPHSLQQFVWYYCTYGGDIEWDALCLPNGYKGTYMDRYCQRAGVFKQVIRGETDYLALPLWDKLKLFIRMFCYYIVGKKENCAKWILNSYVEDFDSYDSCISICDSGFISGIMAMFGQEKEVIYLDDGLGDYNPRTKWANSYKKSSLTYWQSLLLTRMGYSCKGRFYFEPTKYCVKYSVINSEMKYFNYKEMKSMDMEHTDIEKYSLILNKTYPEIEKINFNEIDTILFTDHLKTFSDKCQEYYNACVDYIKSECNTVLLKRHPRDDGIYDFGENVKVIELDSEVPAELILHLLKNKKIYFISFSSIIIFMKQYEYCYTIFYSQDLYEDNLNNKKCEWKFITREKLVKLCERFSKNNYEIVDV